MASAEPLMIGLKLTGVASAEPHFLLSAIPTGWSKKGGGTGLRGSMDKSQDVLVWEWRPRASRHRLNR